MCQLWCKTEVLDCHGTIPVSQYHGIQLHNHCNEYTQLQSPLRQCKHEGFFGLTTL